jgi:hypothetical protein
VRFVETLYADEVNLYNPMQFLGQSRKERFGIAVFADFMRYDWSRNRYSVSVGWISTDKRLGLYRDCPGRRGKIEPSSFGRGSFDRVV